MLDAERSAPRDLELIARHGGLMSRIAVRIPTYLADLKENPAWLAMFVLARTMPVRRAHWLTARPAPPESGTETSMFGDLPAATIAEVIRRNGIFTGLRLPTDIHEAIGRFARETPCFGNFERRLEFLPDEHDEAEARFGRPILSGHHFERVLACEAALEVQHDPLLKAVAQHYLGGQAQQATIRTWWSFPTPGASETDLNRLSFKYHFDLDDWRMLKFFFYINDVGVDAGPHVYIRESHRRRRLKHQLTPVVGHPADEVLAYYGRDAVMTLTGPAGTGFVEDPFGFHMGTLPKARPRLMMEVAYGVSKPSQRRYHGEPVVR